MHTPTIIDLPAAVAKEAAAAKWWRKNVARMTRKTLAEETGYSTSMIQLIERGYDHEGRPLPPRTTRRYRLVCAGLAAELSIPSIGQEETNGAPDCETRQNPQSHG